MEPVVHLRSTVALLGRFPALAGVDLDVGAGEVVMLRGANGAGKTTLLRTCAGLVAVARGEARVLDVDLVADRAAVRPLVGLLGHATALYDDLTALDNVRFWAKAAGVDPAGAANALARVAVSDRLADVAVTRLSTGQRRRVSLAALIVRRPRLWLLDEPHAGLDADARDLLDGLVLEAAEKGATVLLASHELDRAVGLADRVVTIGGGVVTATEPGERPSLRAPLEPSLRPRLEAAG
jgi:heme ABC exporter ATP-binding subunit CcmA